MKIIAVDDEKLLLADLLRQIKKIPSVESAAGFCNPSAALEYVREHEVDAAFLDINMPEIDGLTLAKRMRESQPSIAVIFLTGYSEYALDAFSLHASGYLVKPVSSSDIEEELEHLRPMKKEKSYRLVARAFGNFEVFANGVPLRFARSRAKELFACLVDKRGALITLDELAERFWDDDICDAQRLNQVRTFASSMMDTLRSAGVEDIVIKQLKSLALKADEVDCDYFRFLDGENAGFSDSYMSGYSWGEYTLGRLCAIKELRGKQANG